MRSRILLAALVAGVLAVTVAACGSDSNSSSGSSTALNGSGSTFQAPLVSEWASQLKSQGITINYQGVGSGAGVAQFTQGTTDFAGSDPPLAPEEQKAITKSPPIQIPIALGAITVSYNVSGIKAGLKLDGATIADIFQGKIKTWNDAAIAKLNPGVTLPSEDIVVVHRSDSSGTTKGFTEFLSANSKSWESELGADKDIKWPTGTGAKGNDGVAAAVKQQEGSIGYVEQAYALQNNFTFADVENSSGKFIAPTLESTSAAAEGLDVPKDLGIVAINSPNPDAYPIVSQTFTITYTDPCKAGFSADKAKAMQTFMKFELGDGQKTASQLQYAPLPASLVTEAIKAVDAMTCNGSPIGG